MVKRRFERLPLPFFYNRSKLFKTDILILVTQYCFILCSLRRTLKNQSYAWSALRASLWCTYKSETFIALRSDTYEVEKVKAWKLVDRGYLYEKIEKILKVERNLPV